MKKMSWLLLSFCAIATSMYLTVDTQQKKIPALTHVSRYFPCDNTYPIPTRLTPFLTAENPLELTDGQIATIATLIKNNHAILQPLLGKIVAARKRMHQKASASPFDEQSLQSIVDEMCPLLAEALLERERLDAKIYSVFTSEQRKHAEEQVQSVETLLSEEKNFPRLAVIVAARMNSHLSLSDDQIAEVEKSIEMARREISPFFRKTREDVFSLSQIRCFNESETWNRAMRQAKGISVILLASERVTAKVYGLARKSRKDGAGDAVEVLESYIRERILGLRDLSLNPMSSSGGDPLSFRPSPPGKTPATRAHSPVRQLLRRPARYASTNTRHSAG